MPWRVPSASPGPSVASRLRAQRPLAGLERGELADRVATLQVGVVGRGRQRRQVEHGQLEQPAAGGEQADLAARGGRDRRDARRRGWRGRRPRRSPRRRTTGPAARWRRGTRSTGRRRPRAAPARQSPWSRPTRAGRCGAACRRSWPPRRARRRRPSGAAPRRPRIVSSSSISRRSVLLLLLELDPAEPGQPAQLHVEDVVGLGLGQVEDRHQPLARGAARRRWCGSAG